MQVPYNGQPIVLMNDAQTTGGYPRIACIIEADIKSSGADPARATDPLLCNVALEEALNARHERQRWNSYLGGFSMNIDLNADVGEGFASDSELLTLVLRQYRLWLMPVMRKTMLTCVREALKTAWRRYGARASQLSGSG